jgi:dTMP kinase
MARGKFISFEGGEGTGKSTQLTRLAERLAEAGLEVVRTREPGGTEGADAIRELLVTGATDRWDPVSEVLLNYAARRDHVERVIKPALARGEWVVCDRFADSTMAYQGYGYELGTDLIETVHRATLGDFNPDMTIIMDFAPAEGLARARPPAGPAPAPATLIRAATSGSTLNFMSGCGRAFWRSPNRRRSVVSCSTRPARSIRWRTPFGRRSWTAWEPMVDWTNGSQRAGEGA